MKNKKFIIILSFFTLLLAVVSILGLFLGSASLGVREVFKALIGLNTEKNTSLIVLSLRLPRVLSAILAGGGLSVAGLLLQTVTDNDLCSPNVIGVNSGAGLFVMLVLCFLPHSFIILPIFAFIGAFGTTILVLFISLSVNRHNDKSVIVLSGVAVGTILSAGISLLSQLFPDVLSAYSSFSVGGFGEAYKSNLIFPAIIIISVIIIAWLIAPKVNLFCLGDDLAAALGTSVKLLRFAVLILASALCASVVSFAGLLGFVGLIIPHIAKKLLGRDLRQLIPLCVVVGGTLTVSADLISRTIFSPAELPAGILISFIGAPFFLFLLYKRKKYND